MGANISYNYIGSIAPSLHFTLNTISGENDHDFVNSSVVSVYIRSPF